MPSLSIDTNVLVYLMLIVVLAIIAMSLKSSGRFVVKSVFKIIIAAAGIYLFNYIIGSRYNIRIPFNLVTILIAGLLELPGVGLIFIMKYVIYP